jgi:ring-1,2-phenylacetyl-CoA epoxidase subunit PaaE
MHANYALEAWEVDKGFVLACQSEPLSDTIVIDYDHV